MIAFLVDHNFNEDIVDGLTRRDVALAFTPARDVRLAHAADPAADHHTYTTGVRLGVWIMPRPGGEADKLGNRYEGVWTVDALLNLVDGSIQSVTVEPFGKDAVGIEFTATLPNGSREAHSAKRQTTGSDWGLSDLCRKGSTGRSIVGDLFEKQAGDPKTGGVFVSGTGANQLRELAERAERSSDSAHFLKHLDTSADLRRDFERYIVTLSRDEETGFQMLRRLRVVCLSESELIRRVEQRISLMLYRPDGAATDPRSVRSLLSDFIVPRLGQRIEGPEVVTFLEEHGWHRRDWAIEKTIQQRISQLNEDQLRRVEADLINGVHITRREAQLAVEALTEDDGPKRVLISGSAGRGKTCVISQAIRLTAKCGIPLLVIRLDAFSHVATTRALGRAIDLPESPAVVLAGVSNGGRALLVVDQLDAVSIVSGRNPQMWAVFESLMREADQYPNMRVLLGCRDFDLEHDHRLRPFTAENASAKVFRLDVLSEEEMRQCLLAAGVSTQQLGPHQVELLRLPLHLSLFLQGDPTKHGSFESVQDLYDRYWERKQQLLTERLGRPPQWTAVIDRLVDYLSNNQSLAAPRDVLDEFSQDAQAMASEHVLMLDRGTFRFFHEGFFDYAFARRFSQRGGDLIALLTKPGEDQHLFRRAQVRQILAYQRGRDRAAYVQALRRLFGEPRIRFHLKKVVLNLLGALSDPSEAEWALLRSLRDEPKYGGHVFLTIADRVPWFDLLLKLGVWEKWLNAKDPVDVDEAVSLLSCRQLLEERSRQIGELLAPFRGAGTEWNTRLRKVMSWGSFHHSREMMNLFLALVDDGVFDDAL